jgi:ATP-dependent helicase/nuclease subunit B
MKAAREMYGKKTGKEVIPAGMYYYELKDPMTRLDEMDEWALLKEFRMSGYTNSSPEVLNRIEHGSSDFVSASVKINKNGSPSKTSKVLDSEGFDILEDYVEQKAIELGSRIYEGDIDARPYWKDKKTACAYCGYLTVCGFDPKEGSHYHILKKHSSEDALELIRKQVE